MATLQITTQLNRSNAAGQPDRGNWPKSQISIDADDDDFNPGVMQEVGVAHEVLEVGEVTDSVVAVIFNHHATAIVQIGRDVAATFYPLININPGEECPPIRLTAIADTYVQSDTASTKILVALHKLT